MAARVNLTTGKISEYKKSSFTEKKRKAAIKNIAKGRLMRTAETFKKIARSHTGRKQSQETIMKRSLSLKGRVPWNKGLTKDNNEIMNKISNKIKGINMSEETRLKISLSLKGKIPKNINILNANKKGSGNPMWKGGLSNSPYDEKWGRPFRRFIRNRDGQICMNCGVHREQLKVALPVHHIDYNKQNTIKENCLSLCPTCHGRTQKNRSYWTNLFEEKLNKLYNYNYIK